MDFLQLIFNLVSQFITFLDNFKIIGNLSFLRLFIILSLFSISLKFLVHKKGE